MAERVHWDEGERAPIAAIQYEDAYRLAWQRLRRDLDLDILSEGGLASTVTILDMNAAHFTAWEYRRKACFASPRLLQAEVAFASEYVRENPKNYQVWHHHRCLLDKLNDPQDVFDLTKESLEEDEKNYHAWSHRQWALQRFGFSEDQDQVRVQKEFNLTDEFLDRDVRNNSAWNHRFFILTHARLDEEKVLPLDCFKTEGQIALRRALLAPSNESPWEFCRALAQIANCTLQELPGLQMALEAVTMNDEDGDVPVIPALSLLMDLLESNVHSPLSFKQALGIVRKLEKFDKIRAKYWRYRTKKLERRNVNLAAVDESELATR